MSEYAQPDKIVKPQKTAKKKGDGWLSGLIIYVLAFFLAIPFAVVVYDYIALTGLNNPKINFAIGMIAGNLLAIYMLRSLKALVFIVVSLSILGLSVNQFRQVGYSFENLYHDYSSLLYSLWNHQTGLAGFDSNKVTTEKTDQIKAVVDYESKEVRTFAVKAASTYFNEDNLYNQYGDVIRYFSVFKVVNEQWTYVRDPAGEEYFATATESIELMAGDCDDHTVLMVSCIKAIGGRARMVHVKGHIFPEVNVGSLADFDRKVAYLVTTLFGEQYEDVQLRGHIDDAGEVWLNFDYTSSYPGGPFISEEIIRIVEI